MDLLVLEYTQCVSTPGPLHMLYLLPEMLFSCDLLPALFISLLSYYNLREAFSEHAISSTPVTFCPIPSPFYYHSTQTIFRL